MSATTVTQQRLQTFKKYNDINQNKLGFSSPGLVQDCGGNESMAVNRLILLQGICVKNDKKVMISVMGDYLQHFTETNLSYIC